MESSPEGPDSGIAPSHPYITPEKCHHAPVYFIMNLEYLFYVISHNWLAQVFTHVRVRANVHKTDMSALY